jgi:hypothetical protein
MKSCPACYTQYTDDTLKYCLQDGTPLTDLPRTNDPTISLGETDTLVRPRTNESDLATQPDVFATTPSPVVGSPPRRSNTLLVVLATIFVMFTVLGAIGLGAFLYFRDRSAIEPAVSNKPVAANDDRTPTPTRNTIVTNSNGNAAVSPTPVSQASPELSRATREEVADEIDAWIGSTEEMDLAGLMDHYGDRVDYYNSKGADQEQIRADKVRAFSLFDTIDMNVSNITFASVSDSRISATFDKAWTFEGDRVSRGKVRQQLIFENVGGRWLIVSERDLKVY